VLNEVLKREEYKERLDSERYDFLRTKDLFSQCKDSAADKYGWVKKSL